MEDNRLQVLIEKYIKGTATPAEREELLFWYKSVADKDELVLPYNDLQEEEEAKERLHSKLIQQIQNSQRTKGKVRSMFYKVAAAAAILIVSFVCVFKSFFNRPGYIAQLNVVSTRIGEHKIIHLNDGSTVWLSAGSKVSFPSSFEDSTREITFEGEAFFEIAKDKKHPFIVHTGITSTRVLGTSFNITAHAKSNNITVALITGKVAFSDRSSQVKLLPGRQVVYNKLAHSTQLEDIKDIAAITGRRNGYYEYKNVKVADVVEDINLNLNAKITIEGNVKNCLFYGRIKPGESIYKFLQKLAVVENAKVFQQNGGYLIKGRGCD
jgi:transmembrane sensor